MSLEIYNSCASVISGMLVGLSLTLIGGGGSVLAVPLMLYFVGVESPHSAIGTSAFAVAGNAFIGLLRHARIRNVQWKCGGIIASSGVVGTWFGSSLGKLMSGDALINAFAVAMIVVAVLMLIKRESQNSHNAQCTRQNAPKVVGAGAVTGAMSGFFGIGGGMLLVPALSMTTKMSVMNAVGTSLIAVAAFGLVTTVNYAISGYVDWPLAAFFMLGGLVGSAIGHRLGAALNQKDMLAPVFSFGLIAIAGAIIFT